MPDKEKLQQIVDDPATSDSERREAQVELDALEPSAKLDEAEKWTITTFGPLLPDLLRFAGAREFREITWRDLIRFTDSREWPGKWNNDDVQSLWRGWCLWVGWEASPYYKTQIWNSIKNQFATDQERRAEFARFDREYPLFGLSNTDHPDELLMYERHLSSSDPKSILAITRKKLDEAPEFNFRTREVAERIIAKLTEQNDNQTREDRSLGKAKFR